MPSIKIFAQSSPSLKIVQAKNYYFLSLLDNADKGLADLLANDASLKQISNKKADSLAARGKACGRSRACFLDLMLFSEAEIIQVGERLQALWKKGNELDLLLTQKLIPSGTYSFQQAGSRTTTQDSKNLNQADPAEFLRKAWEQDARGINYAIEVYGNARRPNYPNIDSVDFIVRDPKDSTQFHPSFHQLLFNGTYALDQRFQRETSFYSVPLHFALLLLDLNERDQAADYEPMELGINKAAVKAVKSVNWSKYPYTVILVPGAGPNEYGIALSAEGKVRCRLAVEYYRQGMAPFLLVSGGKVHPYKTLFNEAIEMKRYMVEQLGVPEAAIIADPHARHTTTNMRNASRLMFKYGIPIDRPAVASTTRGQSFMIANTLAERCRKELGYTPFRAGKVLSESLTEFYALKEAFRIDPEEPMDP